MIDIKFPNRPVNAPIKIHPCGIYLVRIKSTKEKKLAFVTKTEIFFIDESGHTSHSDMEWFEDVYEILRDVKDSIIIDIREEKE